MKDIKEIISIIIGILFLCTGLFFGTKAFYINAGRLLVETVWVFIALFFIGIGLFIIIWLIINSRKK